MTKTNLTPFYSKTKVTSNESSNGNGAESSGSRVMAALSESGTERDAKVREAAHELRTEMETMAAELKTLILAQPPADMLGYLWAQIVLSQIHSDQEGGELQIDEARETIIFLLEYVHAVTSCFEADDSQSQDFDEAAAKKAIDVATKLRESAIFYAMASSEIREGEFGEATAEVEFKAKTSWIMIRGNRYQVLEEEFFKFVLGPHDEVLQRAYGIGANEVAAGIQDIANAMRTGHSDAMQTIKESMAMTSQLAQEKGVGMEEAIEAVRSEQPDHALELGKAYSDLFYGGVCNLSRHTKLPAELLADLSYQRGENNEFFEPGDFEGTPLRTLPARIKPLIQIDGDFYATEPHFVRDSAYRALQRGIAARFPEYREEWNRRQKVLTEGAFPAIFSAQLAGADVIKEFYYRDPISKAWVECDTLILVEDVLIHVEAKAGIGAMHSPATNFENHVRAIRNLVGSAYEQTKRFIEYLNSTNEAPLYERRDGEYMEIRRVRLAEYRVVVPIGLTVESFSPFSTMCKQLPQIVPILGLHPFVSMSIDDLFVLNRFLPTAGELMHYLQVRQHVGGIRNANLFDETDHLGAYIQQNRFDMTLREQMAGGADMVVWDQFSEPIDSYYSGDRWVNEDPPSQPFPDELARLLSVLGEDRQLGWLRVDSLVRDLASEARQNLSETIKSLVGTLDTHERRWFLLMGEPAFLIWIAREGAEASVESMTHKAEVATIAAETDEILSVQISVAKDGRFVRCSPLATKSPSKVRRDYRDLVREAAAMNSRIVEYSSKENTNSAPTRKRRKIGRNEPCWCGSSKKYKKCHGTPGATG